MQEKGRRREEMNRIRHLVVKRGRKLKNATYWSPLLPGKRSKSLLNLKRHYGNIWFNVFWADSP